MFHLHRIGYQKFARRHGRQRGPAANAKAVRVLEQGYGRRPDAALFDEGRFVVYRAWMQWLLDEGKTAEAAAVFAAARRLDQARAEVLRNELGAAGEQALSSPTGGRRLTGQGL